MTLELIDVVARIEARKRGRAVLLRQTSLLSPDPELTFGIAPIRVVAEERVQAIAFGLMNDSPTVAINWHPLGRETTCLEPFAHALDEYVRRSLAEGRTPRVWLPYRAALQTLGLLGHRYRRNTHASDPVRRMGWQCAGLAEEATFAGQQVVAVAADLLREHAATGMAPSEELHLGAFLAWIEPFTGVDPTEEAERRALVPAAAMLTRDEDDLIEELRQQAKNAEDALEGELARHRIESILKAAALREWDLLVDARKAFWSLGLSTDRDYEKLEEPSRRRVAWTLGEDRFPASRPHSLSRLLGKHEHAIESAEHLDVGADSATRERARRTGRVFAGEVVAINQPTPNRKPCRLTVRTPQSVLRVRRGTDLQSVDCGVVGKVVAVAEAGSDRLLEIDVTNGVKASTLARLIGPVDWTTTSVFPAFVKDKVYSHIDDAASPLIHGSDLPAPDPRASERTPLIEVAEALRRTR